MASFVFHKNKLRNNLNDLNSAFIDVGVNFKIFYSVKTNFSDPVLETINEKNKFEIVSAYEWEKIKKYSPSELVLNGPSKNVELVDEIFKHGVQKLYFNIDNDTDLNLLDSIIGKHEGKLIVGIRIFFNKTGIWNRFGYDIDGVKLQEILVKYKNIISGFHFHFSTNNFCIDNYKVILEKINNIVEKYQLNIKYIDIGGGLPGASEIMFKNIVFKELPLLIKQSVQNDTLIISEVGRHLVEDTFNLKTTIISLKKHEEDIYDVTVDTNITHFPCFWEKKFGIKHCPVIMGSKKPVFINIFGNSCMQVDKIADNLLISQEPHIGDVVELTKVGAYSLSQASNFITSIPDIISPE